MKKVLRALRVKKACVKCGREKPRIDFYKNQHMADGHLHKCKECVIQEMRDHRRRRRLNKAAETDDMGIPGTRSYNRRLWNEKGYDEDHE